MVHEIPAANRNSKGLNKHFQYHSIVGLNLNKYQPRFYIYTAHGNDHLGQKKFKQINQYRAKGTFCDYMGDYKKKLKNSTPLGDRS